MNRFTYILSLFLFCACSSDANINMKTEKALGITSTVEYTAARGNLQSEPSGIKESPSPNVHGIEKASKIIKSGQMNFEVSNLKSAKGTVDEILKKCNGYYETDQFTGNGNRRSYSLRLRVPSSKFDSLVSVIELGIGELTSKDISAHDITEEYVDLNIRLQNKLAYLQQYKEILKKAKSIEQILTVQEDIRRIEEEIESKKGRISYLDDQANYSSLTIELSELVIAETTSITSSGTRIANAFNNGSKGLLSFVIVLITIWPFFLILTIVFLIRKPIRKRLRSTNF